MERILVTIKGTESGTLKHQIRVPVQRVLQVSSIEAAIDAMCGRLYFGWLPAYRIQSDLTAGELVPLRLPAGGTREVRLNLVCKDLSSLSHEMNVLADMLSFNCDVEEV
jgi:DNA-binding transcriptional LysR family regulator